MGDSDQRQLELGGQRESGKGRRDSKYYTECSDSALFLKGQIGILAYSWPGH